jgi:hypothetical protein
LQIKGEVMDIILTGGRGYPDRKKVWSVLDLLDFNLLVQGGATGADMHGYDYCNFHSIECRTKKADWEKHGKAAGPIRNVEMLEEFPNAIVVAFPGGRGTENSVKEALKRGHIVLRVEDK